jgi:hypothetical protein
MKYEVDLRQVTHRTVEVFAESANAAALLAVSHNTGFQPECVRERLSEDEDGEEWVVDGKCEACGVYLLDGEYFVDGDGCDFCNKCWAELLAETEVPSGGQ